MSNPMGDDRACSEAIQRWFDAEPLWGRALAALRASGSSVYLVGGSVRDALRGHPGDDMDVAVQGSAIQLGRWLADRLGGAFYPMDREHDVARIVFPCDAYYHIDLAGLRGRTILQDLAARDFTINAMGVSLNDDLGILLDPTGGRADLAARVLRMAYADALRDDPARLLRALRLGAALGLELDPETCAQIQAQASLLEAVSPERIRDEFLAMLTLPTAEPILQALDLGLLPQIVPALSHEQALAGIRWLEALHREGLDGGVVAPYQAGVREAWRRSPVDGRQRGALVALAALLADVTTGALAGLGARLRLSGREWGHVRGVLACLQADIWTEGAQGLTRVAAHRYYRRYGEAGVDGAVLAACRPGAVLGVGRRAAYLLWAWFEAHSEIIEPPRLLQGHDLLREFGLEPGPRIGQILDALGEAQVEGRVRTGAQARVYVREILTTERSKGSRV